MMEKPVIISIRGVQEMLGSDEKDVMELVTQGVLYDNTQGGLSLTYEESELTGLEGTTTTFQVERDRIVLKREGNLNSEMIFQEGQRHVSLYETPYGGLMLGVKTRKARSTLYDVGGELNINYVLDVDDQTIGENSFEIQVKEPCSADAFAQH